MVAFIAFVFLSLALLVSVVALARLCARLRLMHQVLQGVDQGVCVLDAKERPVYWNRTLERLCHIEPAIVGVAGHRSIAPGVTQAAIKQSLSQKLSRALLKQRRFSFELETDNGQILHSQGSPVDKDHVMVTYTDVGDIKRSQLAFRDLASRLAATLDNVLDGIITIDDHGIIDSFSSGAEQLFGCSAAAAIGTNIRLMIPEVYASMQDESGAAHPGAAAGLRARREMDARRKNGQLIPIEVGTSELRVAGKRLYICIVRDIAERRRVERLQQEFIATVSHELRTPLTCIIGALGLMGADVESDLPAGARRLLQIAQQNGERLQRLIDDILDSVKTNIEALDLSLETQPINKLIAATIDNNLAFAARFNVRLVSDLLSDHVSARVDPSRLQQVITNLISNAVKFSPADEVVRVTLRRERGFAHISVADRGPGIPENFRSRIFEKFSQADSSDARAGGGTGLGLYIARKLVMRMGGSIDFHSQPGAGTTFRVMLPVQEADVAAEQESTMSAVSA